MPKLRWTFYFLLMALAGWSLVSSCSKKSAGPEEPTRPAAPTNLVGTALDSVSISLSWQDNSSNEDGFRIYYSLDGQHWPVKGTAEANCTSYVATDYLPATEYTFRVKAFNSVGESDFSNTAVVQTPAYYIPPAPDSVMAQALSHTRVMVTWIDLLFDELGYAVQRRIDPDTFVTIHTTGPDTTVYYDDGLTPATLYYYRVGSVGLEAIGWSPADTALTWPDRVPNAPSDLEAEVLMGTGVQLSWQDNSYNEFYFIINRADEAAGFVRLDSVAANDTTYLDEAVVENHTYLYEVQASGSMGDSESSNQVSVYYAHTSAGAIPLAPGNEWDYDVYDVDGDYDYWVDVMRVHLFDSVPWFLMREENGGVDTSRYLRNMESIVEGSGVFYREQGSPLERLLWKYPALEGDYYYVETDCVLVASTKDSVEFLEGMFRDCYLYKRFPVDHTVVETLIKPHVGIVRVMVLDGHEPLSVQKLVSYTILGP